ncbi:hypothetical protein CSW98_15805 [Vibrio sp. HA2012]|uniref:hypothetical protein n=1 Tax=Vibrio sp. HA2012 TaxID=1971595 RepID=UPI000C2BAC1E|nr:hypothetical protein [Vibrio sp. HA2012]PJC85292.1 hypothetical protein CSW98_15805 [Vibrio sp. HA2012]
MKMNLSVVMGVIDKATAPLKKISTETNKYTKEIEDLEKAQAKDSAAMGMIDNYNKLKVAKNQNNLALKAEVEKLNALQQKNKSLQKPSAALIAQIDKQRTKVEKLSNTQDGYKKNLSDVRKALTKTGVTVYKLDDEYKRLDSSYKKHGKEITKLHKQYAGMQKWMRIPKTLNNAIKMPTMETAKKGALAVTGVIGSMAGFGAIINSTAADMDKLAKKSANLQMPIGELQAMQSQAEHAGVSSDALSASMTRFTRRLGVLQQTGKGALGSYLKQSKNGLFKDLKGAENNQQAYQMLLESFSKLKTAQEQMAFADAAFGDSGREMLIMLREGTEGLTAAREELNALGGGVQAEDAAKAEAYNDALQKLQEGMNAIKSAALAPVMQELTAIFTELSDKFKSIDWRNDAIKQLKEVVKGTFEAFRVFAQVAIFVGSNFKELLAVFAAVKIALIGLSLANPFGAVIAAIGVVGAGFAYLYDKFGSLQGIMDGLSNAWDKFWGNDDAADKAAKQAKTVKELQDKSIELGITTNETTNQTERRKTYSDYQTGNFSAPGSYGQYKPLTSQTLNSKSEISLTVKSDKPVTVDKAKSDKGTDLDLNVGDLGFSY